MIKIIRERNYIHKKFYTYDFNFDRNGGFSFPCNSLGEVFIKNLTEDGFKNYEWCKTHLEEFESYGIIEHKKSYAEPAIGKCICGQEVILEEQYMGACQCSKCGQWYNIYGQSLIDPEFWEEDYDY